MTVQDLIDDLRAMPATAAIVILREWGFVRKNGKTKAVKVSEPYEESIRLIRYEQGIVEIILDEPEVDR